VNAATVAKLFDLDATPARTCGRDLCFECCAGTCTEAVDPDGGFELEPLSDADLVAICDALDGDALNLSMEAA
jgi:hypothetical protein